MKEKAIAYIRVSTDEQEKKGYSVPSQKKDCQEYADKNNLEIAERFVEARSGYKERARVEFYKMLEFIQEAEVKHLIFVCTDRLYRNIEDYVRLKETGVNIKLHKVWENRAFHLLDPDAFEEIGRHEQDLIDSKKFSARLSYRVRKIIKEKVEEGIYLGYPPIGYKKNKMEKKIEFDEERAPLVVKAFQLYATGQYGLLDLTKKMKDLGLTTAQGNLVEKNSVYWMLTNPFYKGHFRYSGKIYSNRGIDNDREPSYPILINQELFDEVQQMLRSKNNVLKKSSYEFHLYRKAIQCGFCGCVLTPEKLTKKSGKEYAYYHCTNGKGEAFYQKKFRMKKCPQKWWPAKEIEEEFTSEIGCLHFDEGIMEWFKEELGEHEKQTQEITDAQLKSLRTEQTLNEKKLRKLYEDKVSDVIPEDWFKEEFDRIRMRQDEIKGEIQHLEESEDVSMEESIQTLELMKDFKNQYVTATAEKKVLMHKYIFRTVIAHWRVFEGRNLRGMQFHYNEPFKSLLEIGVMEKSAQLKVPPIGESRKWWAVLDSNQ